MDLYQKGLIKFVNKMEANSMINNLKMQIFEYYKMSFENEIEDYEYNKKLKQKLKDVIIENKNDSSIIEKALLVLAETTGCAEDHKIAEEIMDSLFKLGIINNEQLNFYYNNVATGRWL